MIRARPWKTPSPLPGFGVTLAFTLVYLSIIVLIPPAALIARAARLGVGGIAHAALDSRVLSSLRVTFGVSLAAALTARWVPSRKDDVQTETENCGPL